jgi:hypothetical protein
MLCAGKFSSYEVHWWKVACISVRYFDKRTCLFGGWKGTNFIPAFFTSVARLIVILYCLAAGHGFP